MEIIFKSYTDMVYLEKLLTSRSYTSPSIGSTYYKAFNRNNIRTFMGRHGSLLFVVNITEKTYKILYHSQTTIRKFTYPLDTVAIKNNLFIPSYGGRSIIK